MSLIGLGRSRSTNGKTEGGRAVIPDDALPSRQPERQFKKRHYLKRDYTGKSITERCQKSEGLPPWVKDALYRRLYMRETYSETVKFFPGKKPALLARYAASPGGREWIAANKAIFDQQTPTQRARVMATLQGPALVKEAGAHLLAAKLAGDLPEYGRQLRYLLKLAEVETSEGKQNAPISITINLQGQTLTIEPEMGDSTFEPVIEAEIIDDT